MSVASCSSIPLGSPRGESSTMASRPDRSRRRRGCATCILPLIAAVTLLPPAAAELTLYTGQGDVTTTSLTPGETYSGLPAYDPTTLTPPDPPSPPVTSFTLALPNTADGLVSAGFFPSIPQKGNFLGFSIELSVADSIMGKNGQQLKPEFLNYMGNIKSRAGSGPVIRVGGNTQDSSTVYPQGVDGGSMIEKIQVDGDYGNTITTPIINYSLDVFYTMANVSSLVSTEWFFGLAFNQSDVNSINKNSALVAEYAQKILGPTLRGLVVGNEPDLYVDHNKRGQGWGVSDYITEYNALTQNVLSSAQLSNMTAFVGPSLCCQEPGFQLTDVFNAGYLSEQNSPHIAAVTVQHYPANNCQLSGVIDPQTIFADFLSHASPKQLTALYTGDVAAARAAGKDIIMMEMNTASCGGFPGLSDSFGAAMWITDWSLQLAHANFSNALMHVGGQNVYYNPFTPTPGSYPSYYQWTTGSVYYSTLVVAEAFGRSNQSQIVDIGADYGNDLHPAYAVYEGGVPTRVVLFNYVSDPSGASGYQVTITVGDNAIANTVSVRYLAAATVSEQYNITWAGQSLGASFTSDGRLYGDLETTTVNCKNGQCLIPVPAPAIAVVYLTEQALTDSSVQEDATNTYATTVIGTGSATVDPKVLETSNGQISDGRLGSTSEGSTAGADRRIDSNVVGVLLGVALGAALF